MSYQLQARRTDTNVPVTLVVDKGGGVTGLTAKVQIRDGASNTSYLDFADNTFKTAGWTTKQFTLSDIGGGAYAKSGGLSVAAITNLPSTTNHLIAEFSTTGTVTGVAVDAIYLDTLDARIPAALVSGRMDSSVGAMAAGVVTAAAVATDAIDADALAADAITEIQFGLATAVAVAGVQADTDDIQSRLPTGLVGGRMDSSVGAMVANTLTASALATDAREEIADQVWDEALAGHLAAGSTGEALNTASATGLQARVDQAWTRSIAGGSKFKGVFVLHQNGQVVAVPGTARLEVKVYSSAGALLFTQANLVPNATGYWEIQQTFTPTDGTVLASFAKATLVPGTFESVVGIAIPEFAAG